MLRLGGGQVSIIELVLFLTAEDITIPDPTLAQQGSYHSPHTNPVSHTTMVLLQNFPQKWHSDNKLYGLAFTYLNLVDTFSIYFTRQIEGYNFILEGPVSM